MHRHGGRKVGTARELPRRIVRRIGRRGGSLLFLALVDFAYAGSLAAPAAENAQLSTTRFIAALLPLWVWALLWAVVGVVCLVGAFRVRDGWAFAAAMALKVLWSTTFLLGWAFAGLERGWIGGVIFAGFAAFAYMISGWAEPPAVAHPPPDPPVGEEMC